MKAHIIHVLKLEPLTVEIRKNGRSISIASAKGTLAKAYPEIPIESWSITRLRGRTTRAVCIDKKRRLAVKREQKESARRWQQERFPASED